MLRVGVVGLRHGRGLFRVFHNHRNAQVTAVCDVSVDRAEQVAAEFGVAGVYSDFEAFLKSGPDSGGGGHTGAPACNSVGCRDGCRRARAERGAGRLDAGGVWGDRGGG